MSMMRRIDEENRVTDASLDRQEVHLMHRVSLSVTCVLVVFGSLFGVVSATASTVCQTTLPANIGAGILEQQMILLLQRSETFRQQCRRIAEAPYVRVRFEIGMKIEGGGRAQAVINRYEAGAVVAFVTMGFAQDYFELIPHELEHVIEQIDGVRLPDELVARRAWIAPCGSYETRRASAMGTKVRKEVNVLTVEAVQHDGLKAPAPRNPFD